MQLDPVPLEGRHVRLEPFAEAHKEALRPALDTDQETWAILTAPAWGPHYDGWWKTALDAREKGTRSPYAVRRLSDGEIVGTTSYHDYSAADRHTGVGYTFYHPSVRAGVVNPECKLLMIGNAFDAGAIRVELVADGRNIRSQNAIAKLGAVKEAVLRHNKITWTGYLRDTVVFSILADEWPAVRAGLEKRIQAFG
ncbi:MAG: GNAT family N-acetyltransferase [Caulobacteraceae bacterium]